MTSEALLTLRHEDEVIHYFKCDFTILHGRITLLPDFHHFVSGTEVDSGQSRLHNIVTKEIGWIPKSCKKWSITSIVIHMICVFKMINLTIFTQMSTKLETVIGFIEQGILVEWMNKTGDEMVEPLVILLTWWQYVKKVFWPFTDASKYSL